MTEILESVFENYRALQSYSDSGTVAVEIESIGKKFSGEKKLLTGSVFATNFMRNALGSATEPHLFRYQFTSTGHFAELKEDNLNFICSNHEGVFKRSPEEGLSPCPSLALAVADTAALSFAGSYYIASLLMAGIVEGRQWFFNRLSDIELVNNTDQMHLRAKIKDGLVDLFIDAEQLIFSQMIVARPTSTAKFVWQDTVLNGEINTRVFDQYRF
ncbi:MAG: hypothetical protein WC028_00955 [Candidatus Obscuribacterales bacterium]